MSDVCYGCPGTIMGDCGACRRSRDEDDCGEEFEDDDEEYDEE